MHKRLHISAILNLPFWFLAGALMAQTNDPIALPAPAVSSSHSLESLLQRRRSVREYPDVALSLAQIGQLLWAAQGITHGDGYRTAPSAGALYPLELYVVANHVTGLAKGIYHYQPKSHVLINTVEGDVRNALAEAALAQSSVEQAAAVIVFTAVMARTEKKYGKRAERYVHIEVGHAAENLFLQAESLGLATVDVGAFHDREVSQVLHLPASHVPLLLMPIGHK
jgi:SagB-type dehydrogenase family enzyme